MMKTHSCGELRLEHVDQKVTLAGWVHRRRDHGSLIFLDLRDRDGIAQVVCSAVSGARAHTQCNQARVEYVMQVEGTVRARPEGLRNPNLSTGDVEVVAEQVCILNPARTPPFYINEDVEVEEPLRLRYRYLDLRRSKMQRNLLLRNRMIQFIRNYLHEQGFIEIETPILLKSTPEGARDYIVPSRIHRGRFYALPQSPQQLKQLLMVAGFERYFQIARCFRDEDLRADRQPEFTQLDMEMSFVDEENILDLIEDLFMKMVEELRQPDPAGRWPHINKQLVTRPFTRLTYTEAMERYGSDKPDLRYGLPLFNVSGLVAQSEFKVFRSAVEADGLVKGIRAPDCARFSRREIDELTAFVGNYGARGLAWIVVEAQERNDAPQVRSPIAKFLSREELQGIITAAEARAGDLILLVADRARVVNQALGALRQELARRLDLIDPTALAFAWITDFPLLEWNEDENRWDAVHHPFTSAKDSDWKYLLPGPDHAPGRARAKAYDVVCNGWEIGGGSIRIHQRDQQNLMFQSLGLSEAQIEAQFGHMLTAFEYGAPPHGGIAPGIDRMVAILAGEQNIREVIAFPKTAQATDLMVQAPSEVSPKQLQELGICIRGE